MTRQQDLKKGSAELLILSLLEERARHGYEIGQLIESRSGGALSFHVASLYPILYRLEKKKYVTGRWVEKPKERRRRYYSITEKGRQVLSRQRNLWKEFFEALNRVAQFDPAGGSDA